MTQNIVIAKHTSYTHAIRRVSHIGYLNTTYRVISCYLILSFFSLVPSPPIDVTVVSRTTDSFTVTWTAPDSELFTGYKMTISEGDNVNTETPAKDVTSVEVTGLTPGTAYSVTLVTINNQDDSSMLTTAASTRKLRLLFIL